ncbi:MAG: ABC transporter ATP-binding protein [Deltaproteobacteria bacterium]|nr:ABC transporter ATP-binding protein [Deltaproteobacteria bacterium]
MGQAIGIYGLIKKFNGLTAVNDVSLEIPEGEFFGLLGPNGAGKTTLISCLVGLARPTDGRVEIDGVDVSQNPLRTKPCIGFVPQEVNVEYFFPIDRILEFQGGYFGLPIRASRARAEALLRQFGLWERRDVQYFRLSGGMKRRLMIVRALMGEPRVLILDEPTAGVDVAQRRELWDLLRQLRAQGVTILLTTHYIDEAEALCDRVGIIDRGQIVELDAPRTLIHRYCSRRVVIDLAHPVAPEALRDIPGTWEVTQNGYRLLARPPAGDHRLGELTEALMRQLMCEPAQRICDLQIEGGDLEEVFVQVTGRGIDAAAHP